MWANNINLKCISAQTKEQRNVFDENGSSVVFNN